MASDISPVTGELYYSGEFVGIVDILRVLNISEGVMSQVTQQMVNRFQEMVDREMDALFDNIYQTPIRAVNQWQPSGMVLRVFPGDVRRAAKYWTAGLLLLAEFQQLESNSTDQARQMVDDARKQVFEMVRTNHRIPGQRRKSSMSHTMPANLQPSMPPEVPS